ncbi:helix-turn-helix domain-containing protein [Sanguibacter sp. Leaf3]|uniref:helix-turn-helix domain-containing protein n=1 Tax=Sanguibacter sp. Leaf3 TaxID=1736209 RepID=UPI000A429DE3|nr:helix-turn-helix domain-containing protein [Sanguibacter sp. Leaf3]
MIQPTTATLAARLLALLPLLRHEAQAGGGTRRPRATVHRARTGQASTTERARRVLRPTTLPGGESLSLLVDIARRSIQVETGLIDVLAGERFERRIEDVEGAVAAIADLCAVASAEGLADHRLVRGAGRWLQSSVDRAERALDLAVVGARVAAPAGIAPCECGATAWTLPTGWATTHEPVVVCTGCGAERAFDAWISQAVVEVELITAQQAAEQLGVSAATVRSWAHRGRLAPVSSRGRLREGSRDRSPLYRASDVQALIAA